MLSWMLLRSGQQNRPHDLKHATIASESEYVTLADFLARFNSGKVFNFVIHMVVKKKYFNQHEKLSVHGQTIIFR